MDEEGDGNGKENKNENGKEDGGENGNKNENIEKWKIRDIGNKETYGKSGKHETLKLKPLSARAENISLI